jgi:hypothetical protein
MSVCALNMSDLNDGGDNNQKKRVRTDEKDDLTLCEPKNKQAKTRIRVAIIGTAGRKGLDAKMSKTLFEYMVQKAESVIVNEWKLPWSDVELISGGAAWSDHVAVELFLQQHTTNVQLKLFIPCPIVINANNQVAFKDTGSNDWRSNPGRSANWYHGKFAKMLGVPSTVAEIDAAIKLGAVIDSSGKGFYERDLKVGQCDYMLAFSWDDTTQPTSGGTAHTWKHSTAAHKLHVKLSTL